MIGDLHVHTTRSDGSSSPCEAVMMARSRELSYIGIVDHDRTDGLEDAIALGARIGVLVVPGVEISAYDRQRGRRVHLLGYCFRSPATHIDALCAPLLEARDAMTRRQVETLASAGFPLTLAEVREASGGAKTLYKQHIMKVLVEKGLADGLYGEVYHSLFRGKGICAAEIEYVDALAAMRAIHDDGGIAVLAHPGQLDSWDLMEELLAAGLDGVELFHESHRLEDHRRIRASALRYPGLILTGGSDDHGSLGSDTSMGEIRAPHDAQAFFRYPPHLPHPYMDRVLRDAGDLLRRALADYRPIEEKDGNRRDLVTRHDTIVQDFLISAISSRFPGRSFIAEERVDPDPDPGVPTWIIDPIDGTTNFASTGRDFTISVALYRGGKPELGLVYDVVADELYAAAPGQGAYVNGMRLGPTGVESSLSDSIVDVSADSMRVLREVLGIDAEPLALAGRGHRALGCASLSICRIARGMLDVYISGRLALWDHAAADIVLAESGGSSWFRPHPGSPGGTRDKRIYVAARRPELLSETVAASHL